MADGPAARGLQCERCQASFSVEALTSRVHCPYCGHAQALDSGRELRDYQAAVDRHVAAADEQLVVASALEAWNASRAADPKKKLLVVYGLMLGVPFVLALVLIAAIQIGLLPRDGGPGFALVIGGSSYLGLVGYFVWYFTGRKRREERRAELAPVRVACPTCGAPGMLTPGQGIDRCSYCDGGLIPSHAAMQRGLDAARAARREAALSRNRAQRQASAQAKNLGIGNILAPILIGGSMILMLVVSTIGVTVEMVRGTEPFHPAVFLLWAFTLAAVVSLSLYLSRRRERRSVLRRTLADLVRQFGGGEVLHQVDQRVAWINRWWSADYDPHHWNQTYVAGSAAVEVAGLPALVDVDLHDRKPPPRVDALLVAWVPGLSESDGGSRRVKDRELSNLGFVVRETPGGLVAEAQKPLLDACRRDPSAVHVVAPVLHRLAAIAEARGLEPVGPTAGS